MAVVHELQSGSRNSNGTWVPFEFNHAIHGPQAKGELIVVRSCGTSGNLLSGLWRTGHGMPGCNEDGTCDIMYSAPTGDENIVFVEGSTEVTVVQTGKTYQLEAGKIMSHPKDLDLVWKIKTPFLKKFWTIWDSSLPGTKSDDVHIGNISDNPAKWTPYSWDEPTEGPQKAGELTLIRGTGSTGSMSCGKSVLFLVGA